jgi:hypothetical protein
MKDKIRAYWLEQVEGELFNINQEKLDLITQQMLVLSHPGDHTTELSSLKRIAIQLRMSELVLLKQKEALKKALEE